MSTVSGTFSTGFGADFSGTGFVAERPRPVTPRLRLTKRGRGVLMTVAATPLVIGAFLFPLRNARDGVARGLKCGIHLPDCGKRTEPVAAG